MINRPTAPPQTPRRGARDRSLHVADRVPDTGDDPGAESEVARDGRGERAAGAVGVGAGDVVGAEDGRADGAVVRVGGWLDEDVDDDQGGVCFSGGGASRGLIITLGGREGSFSVEGQMAALQEDVRGA